MPCANESLRNFPQNFRHFLESIWKKKFFSFLCDAFSYSFFQQLCRDWSRSSKKVDSKGAGAGVTGAVKKQITNQDSKESNRSSTSSWLVLFLRVRFHCDVENVIVGDDAVNDGDVLGLLYIDNDLHDVAVVLLILIFMTSVIMLLILIMMLLMMLLIMAMMLLIMIFMMLVMMLLIMVIMLLTMLVMIFMMLLMMLLIMIFMM